MCVLPRRSRSFLQHEYSLSACVWSPRCVGVPPIWRNVELSDDGSYLKRYSCARRSFVLKCSREKYKILSWSSSRIGTSASSSERLKVNELLAIRWILIRTFVESLHAQIKRSSALHHATIFSSGLQDRAVHWMINHTFSIFHEWYHDVLVVEVQSREGRSFRSQGENLTKTLEPSTTLP